MRLLQHPNYTFTHVYSTVNIIGIQITQPSNIQMRGAETDPLSSGRHETKDAPRREEKSSNEDYIKPIVFGGLDGILTSFTVVSAAAGGELSWKIVRFSFVPSSPLTLFSSFRRL